MGEIVVAPPTIWGFDGGDPCVVVGAKRPRHEKVDPTPCYTHDPKQVKKLLALCEERWPVKHSPKVYLLDKETLGRTNGWTSFEEDYKSHESYPFIVLMGKRIPILTAMTRYLVTHEYGHVVDATMAHERYRTGDLATWEAEAIQDAEYRELRGMKEPAYYGPGTWHESIGEVFANDFRILICESETDFWPHPCKHPLEDKATQDWWKARMKEKAIQCKCGICFWCK